LPTGLSGLSFAGGAGGPTVAFARSEYGFPVGVRFCLGPEVGVGFGDHSAVFLGGTGRFYFVPISGAAAQPHIFGGGGLLVADDEGTRVREAEAGPYVNFGAGCDVDIPSSSVCPYFDVGAFVSPGREPKVDYKVEAGIRLNVSRALWYAERDRDRRAAEERFNEKLARARDARDRGDHAEAIALCRELLAEYPDREEARDLLRESEELLAASRPEPAPTPRPKPVPKPEPKPEPEPEPAPIPDEAVDAYKQGRAALAGGSIDRAVYIFSAVLNECPMYGDARDGLVEAYTFQGLDRYSRGNISSALASWRKALIYDPGNAKVKRYIDKANSERQ
jgi:hypothetical protein